MAGLTHITNRTLINHGVLLTGIIILHVIIGCEQKNEFKPAKARDLIFNNIFLNKDRFPINDPKAYQYGTVHVDGPDGGVIYRFRSNPKALKWIINYHRLRETRIDSIESWPPDHIGTSPSWWQPLRDHLSTCFVRHEKLETGGEKLIILIYSPEDMFYVVEHFSGIPGV